MIKYCYTEQRNLQRKEVIDQLRDHTVYPLDLSAFIFCKENNLNVNICKGFYDQDSYNKIFEKVIYILMAYMYDTDLFFNLKKELKNVEVNPLFICMRQLIVLYGGIILKIFELNSILNDNYGKKTIILETSLHSRSFLPQVDHYEVASIFFKDKFSFLNFKNSIITSTTCSQPKTNNLKAKLELLRINAICCTNNFLISLCKKKNVNLHMMFGVPDQKNILKKSKKNKWLPGLKLHSVSTEPINQIETNDKYVGKILSVITKKIFSEFEFLTDLDSFSTLINYTYEQYSHELETPVSNVFKYKNRNQLNINKKGRTNYLFAGVLTKPFYRTYLYKKYLEGYKIIFLEYSDGFLGGIKEDMTHLYRSAPISNLSIYDNQISNKTNQNYFKECEFLKTKAKLVNVSSLKKIKKTYHLDSTWKNRKLKKLYYIPTSFSGHLRVGPNREINDIIYWNIQADILNTLSQIRDVQVIYKAHPKSKNQVLLDFQLEYIKKLGIKIEYKYLNNYLDDIDIVVSDYFASGMSDCLFLDRPIVYLDFGINKFFKLSKEFLSNVILWIECSIRDCDWQGKLEKSIVDILNGKNNHFERIVKTTDHIDKLFALIDNLEVEEVLSGHTNKN